eukprot:GILI01001268.1.p1 GENE.GILI01001268.1~~GILI01001268.1.p1  ORF type:complete len:877 (-),score=216.05 GILI01001268.1:234-2585(-)
MHLYSLLKDMYEARMEQDIVIAQVIQAAGEVEKMARVQEEVCREAPEACKKHDAVAKMTEVLRIVQACESELDTLTHVSEVAKWATASTLLRKLQILLDNLTEAAHKLTSIQIANNQMLTLETKNLVETLSLQVKDRFARLRRTFDEYSGQMAVRLAEKSVADLKLAALTGLTQSAEITEQAESVKLFIAEMSQSLSEHVSKTFQAHFAHVTNKLAKIQETVEKLNRNAELDKYATQFPRHLDDICPHIKVSTLSSLGGNDERSKCHRCVEYFRSHTPHDLYDALNLYYVDSLGHYRVPGDPSSFWAEEPQAIPSVLPSLPKTRKTRFLSSFIGSRTSKVTVSGGEQDVHRALLKKNLKELYTACVVNGCKKYEQKWITAGQFQFSGMCNVIPLPQPSEEDKSSKIHGDDLIARADAWAKEKGAEQHSEYLAAQENLRVIYNNILDAQERANKIVEDVQAEKLAIQTHIDELREKRAALAEQMRQEEATRVQQAHALAQQARQEQARMDEEALLQSSLSRTKARGKASGSTSRSYLDSEGGSLPSSVASSRLFSDDSDDDLDSPVRSKLRNLRLDSDDETDEDSLSGSISNGHHNGRQHHNGYAAVRQNGHLFARGMKDLATPAALAHQVVRGVFEIARTDSDIMELSPQLLAASEKERELDYLSTWTQHCTFFPHTENGFACCACQFNVASGSIVHTYEQNRMCPTPMCYEHFLHTDNIPGTSWAGGMYVSEAKTDFRCSCNDNSAYRGSPTQLIPMSEVRKLWSGLQHFSFQQALSLMNRK